MEEYWKAKDATPSMKKLQARGDFHEMPDGSFSTGNFDSPPQDSFDTEEMRGSMQYILARNIGQYVVVEFLIGTQEILRKQGMLYHVGRSYLTLYDETLNNFIVCDVFSVKFVYFYYPGDRPRGNFNALGGGSGNAPTGRRG